jgi:hypothetical protein
VGFHDSKSILRCQQSTPARRDAEDNHILHVAMGLEKFHALAAERTEGCKLDPTHNLLHILLEVHHPRVHVDDQGWMRPPAVAWIVVVGVHTFWWDRLMPMSRVRLMLWGSIVSPR